MMPAAPFRRSMQRHQALRIEHCPLRASAEFLVPNSAIASLGSDYWMIAPESVRKIPLMFMRSACGLSESSIALSSEMSPAL